MAETAPAKRQRPTRGKRNMSPEAREKLSKLAKQRIADGKMGGSKFGKLGGRGNTREKRRAATDLAEAVRDPAMVELMKQTLLDSQDAERPMKQRLDGLKLATEIEREDAKLALAEEKADAEQLSREELIAALRESLTTGPAATMIRNQLEGENIVDAVVVEDDGSDAEAA